MYGDGFAIVAVYALNYDSWIRVCFLEIPSDRGEGRLTREGVRRYCVTLEYVRVWGRFVSYVSMRCPNGSGGSDGGGKV